MLALVTILITVGSEDDNTTGGTLFIQSKFNTKVHMELSDKQDSTDPVKGAEEVSDKQADEVHRKVSGKGTNKMVPTLAPPTLLQGPSKWWKDAGKWADKAFENAGESVTDAFGDTGDVISDTFTDGLRYVGFDGLEPDDKWGINGKTYPRNQCWFDGFKNYKMFNMPMYGAHNSAAAGEETGVKTALWVNQYFTVGEQLLRGVRFFDFDYDSDKKRFNHGGYYFKGVKELMTDIAGYAGHCPNDIYILNLNDHRGDAALSLKQWYDELKEVWKTGPILFWWNTNISRCQTEGQVMGLNENNTILQDWWVKPYALYAGSVILTRSNVCNLHEHSYGSRSFTEGLGNDDFTKTFCEVDSCHLNWSEKFVVIDQFLQTPTASRFMSPSAAQNPGHAWERCRNYWSPPTVFSYDLVEGPANSDLGWKNNCCAGGAVTLMARELQETIEAVERFYVSMGGIQTEWNGWYILRGGRCHGLPMYQKEGDVLRTLHYTHANVWVLNNSTKIDCKSGWIKSKTERDAYPWNVDEWLEYYQGDWSKTGGDSYVATGVGVFMPDWKTPDKTLAGYYVVKSSCNGKPRYHCVEGACMGDADNKIFWSAEGEGKWMLGNVECNQPTRNAESGEPTHNAESGGGGEFPWDAGIWAYRLHSEWHIQGMQVFRRIDI